MPQPQNLKNHTRFDPLFHFVTAPLLLLNLIAAVWHCFRVRTIWSGWQIVLAIAFILMLLLLRSYALKVQDRVIRLEERLRLVGLGGEAMRSTIAVLTERQLVALRFASDAEAVPLAIRAATESLTPKQIKESIRDWRADNHRV